jgi:hypothetical protein
MYTQGPFFWSVRKGGNGHVVPKKYEMILHIRQHIIWKNISRQMCFDLDGCFYTLSDADDLLNETMQYR